MTDQSPVKRYPPSSFGQMLTVTRYELLKHLRSKRLIGSIAVIALIVTLIYIIPPALNNPYSGHVTETVTFIPKDNKMGYAYLNHSDIVNTTITVHVNGTLLAQSNWTYEPQINAVFFYGNLSGKHIVADFDFKQSSQDFAERFMQFANTLIVILVTFFGADAIVSEYQNRTAYLLFPNPVSREIMFAGKFIASFVASLIMIGLFYILTMSLSLATLGDVAKYLPLSFCFAALFLVACLAVAFFISSILKGSTGAIILTFFMFLMILPIVMSVGMLSGAKMWFLISFMGDLPTTSLSWDHYPVDSSQTQFGFTFYNFYPDPGTSVAVLLAYLVIFSILTIILFRRKQLLG